MSIPALRNGRLTQQDTAAAPGIQHTARSGYKLARKAFHAVENYELSYQRARRLRKDLGLSPRGLHGTQRVDHALLNPVLFKCKTVRMLIKAAMVLEETGEFFADISNLTERFTRHCISDADKTDLAKIAAAATGRAVSKLVTSLVGGGNKMAAAVALGLSCIASGIALGLIKSRFGELRSPTEVWQKIHEKKSGNIEIYPKIAGSLENRKIESLNRAVHATEQCSPKVYRRIKQIRDTLCKNKPDAVSPNADRTFGTNYMWNNRHQYSKTVRGLLNTANLVFTLANKALCSYDKHLGVLLGKKVLARHCGQILGTRCGLMTMYTIAAILAVPLSTAGVSLSLIGIQACAASFALLLLAKGIVAFNGGWKGDFDHPIKPFRPLAV